MSWFPQVGKAAVCPEKYLGPKDWPYQVRKCLKLALRKSEIEVYSISNKSMFFSLKLGRQKTATGVSFSHNWSLWWSRDTLGNRSTFKPRSFWTLIHPQDLFVLLSLFSQIVFVIYPSGWEISQKSGWGVSWSGCDYWDRSWFEEGFNTFAIYKSKLFSHSRSQQILEKVLKLLLQQIWAALQAGGILADFPAVFFHISRWYLS